HVVARSLRPGGCRACGWTVRLLTQSSRPWHADHDGRSSGRLQPPDVVLVLETASAPGLARQSCNRPCTWAGDGNQIFGSTAPASDRGSLLSSSFPPIEPEAGHTRRSSKPYDDGRCFPLCNRGGLSFRCIAHRVLQKCKLRECESQSDLFVLPAGP